MHPNRRRKKRPNYGIRTVEVLRGPNGFGFTISGQQPCILSCIVSNSPADQAGLRAGDFLISVNGMSVSKMPHDAVVNLIGNSVGPIKMTIAENYYSDSSDEELDFSRLISTRKPKYMHKPRFHRCNKETRNSSSSNHGTSNNGDANNAMESPIKKAMKLHESTCGSGDINVNQLSYSNNNNCSNKENSNQLQFNEEAGPIEYKAIIGYLGTIEMPNQLLPNNRLQTVCTCIRKLRQEKRVPTTVLMTVLPTCLTLKNASNHILAIYPTNRVVYISSSTDKDSRYFGLVTSAICENRSVENLKVHVAAAASAHHHPNDTKPSNDNANATTVDISNSCHVFVTDPKLIDHTVHLQKAQTFNVNCTTDVVTGYCLEFPKNALYIVSLVQNMYRLQDPNDSRIRNEELLANSPQPSASSNSDSGIGFRDDCGNVSDRILVVEFPAHRTLPVLSPGKNANRPVCIVDDGGNKLAMNNEIYGYHNTKTKSFEFVRPNDWTKKTANNNRDETDGVNLNNVRAYGGKNYEDNAKNYGDSGEESCNRLTVRAMPQSHNKQSNDQTDTEQASGGCCYAERAIDVPHAYTRESLDDVSLRADDTDFKGSIDNVSMHSTKSLDLPSGSGGGGASHFFKTPKLFGRKKRVNRNVAISCDNLLTAKDDDKEHHRLSPKVYRIAANFSCGELNNLTTTTATTTTGTGAAERCCMAYGGSLQDLCTTMAEYADVKDDRSGGGNNSNKKKRRKSIVVAQSEPDVRLESRNSKNSCEENEKSNGGDDDGGPAGWAISFEKLLDDRVGLHLFAEFLKKEFSAENIYFWAACERYRRLPAGAERASEAQRIYRRHLCKGAPEAVNVDSQGRQQCTTEQSLQEADATLFDKVQKQIFNLMKFDCYPRFLKSDLYKQSLATGGGGGHVSGTKIDAGLLIHPTSTTMSSSPNGKLKKSLSNAEDRRRKSLLPWHRKNRSKSKDRGESEYNMKKVDSGDSTAVASSSDGGGSDRKNDNNLGGGCCDDEGRSSSKSSLTSLDMAQSGHDSNRLHLDDISGTSLAKTPLCRVTLTNGSTTVVPIRQSETVQEMINRLLDKRGLVYSGYEVFTNANPKCVNLNDPSTKLTGCEVTVEKRVHFKLFLPNDKIISVKSKCTKIVADILRAILNRYGYSLEQVRVHVDGLGCFVNMNAPVTAVENRKLAVQLKEGYEDQPSRACVKHVNEDITNKVYRDIIQSKGDMQDAKPVFDRCSVKSEDWGSEHSSGIFGKFLRRDSAMHERKKKSNNAMMMPRSKGNSVHSSAEEIIGEHNNNNNNNGIKKPLIAKIKSGVKLHVAANNNNSEKDELMEGLNRAVRARLEDQRGTEINFELPDFLKDKENNEQKNVALCRKVRRTDDHVENNRRAMIVEKTTTTSNLDWMRKIGKLDNAQPNYENRNIMSCSNNNNKIADDQSRKSVGNPSCVKQNVNNNEDGLYGSNSITNNNGRSNDPPPLPPKPKVLPMKPSNWGQNLRSKQQGLYLEQPTSSFV